MCGCKGCQEITTVDLANNTETITQLPTEECGPINSTVKVLSCECGITLDIYNDSGILVESNESGMYDGGEGGFFYEFTNSTIWTSQLGLNYILRITYNYLLSRWELSYYNEDLGETVIIGMYYSDSACPTSILGWDLDCISFVFQPRLTPWVITWNGEYFNGRKKYSSFFDDPGAGGAFTWEFFWDTTGRWTITRTPGDPFNWAYADPNINCVPTEVTWYNYEFNNPSLYQTFPVGVNGYNARITPIECQCCDEKLTLAITLNDKPPQEIEIIAEIVTEESPNNTGNPLIYNGYPYYSFNIEGDIYYIIFSTITNSWIVTAVPYQETTIIVSNSSNSLCPYGYYTTNAENFLRFWVKGYDCGDKIEKDFCEKLHKKQCEFAIKTLNYLKHLQFGNTCCDELDNLKNDKRVLEILNCYDTRDIPANTTEYNTIPYVQIKRLLGC